MSRTSETSEASEVVEAEANLKIVKLVTRVEQISEKGERALDKDIVAFLGPTKSGKSTLINGLIGTKLKYMKDKYTLTASIIKDSNEPGPKIGLSGQSETEEPECFKNLPGTDYAIWDFAGFGDNKGTEQEIVNALSYQAILRPQKSIRFVLVVPYYMLLSDDPLPFYKILFDLQRICPEIGNSLSIVSTKDENSRVNMLLEKIKSYEFPKANENNTNIINKSKKIIERVLVNKTCIDFKAPIMEDGIDKGLFILPNENRIIDCIKKLEGTKVSDVPLVVSDQAKHDIAELYTVFYQNVKREVETTSRLIENYIQMKIDDILEAKQMDGRPTNAASRHAHFKRAKSKIDEVIQKSTNFESFFREVCKAGVGVDERFSETIKKFIFVENLRNMYKKNKADATSEGEAEFFGSIQVALQNGAMKYSDLITTSEVATEEEKKLEEGWKSSYNNEVRSLKEKISRLERSNSSVLERGLNPVEAVIGLAVGAVRAMSRCVIS